MRKTNIIITSSIIIILAIVFGGISYYQATHFNAHVTINDTKVGGLTADEAIKKLQSTVLKNVLYVGNQQILDGSDTKMAFTNQDLPNVEKVLKSQWSFFPSSKAQNYSLAPSNGDPYRSQTMKQQLEKKLTEMNKSLTAPKDAEAHLEGGSISVSKSIAGKQYDVAQMVKDYENQEYNSEIHLKPVYIKPVKEDSPIVKKEQQMLQDLAQRTVQYTVQNQVYTLKASDLIPSASVTKDMKYVFDSGNITNKIAEINAKQSTLNKYYTFKTHTGSVIQVKGASYGWALDVSAESERVKEAFEKGESSLSAYYVYGVGWNHHGIGYHVTTNNGIGNTYAEVSIKDQRIWLYKNGKLMVTTNVVSGWHDVHEDTPTGVWYIEYKQTPAVLRGTEVGNINYSVKVNYWAPFTLNGDGFHDASWRTNWASNAYLTNGSGGCLNTPLSIIKTVYDNLSQNEPVVIY